MEPPGEIKALQRALAGVQAGRHGHGRRGPAGQGVLRLLRRRAADYPDHGLAPHPVIIHNRLKNIPDENIFWGSDTNFCALYKPEQCYIAQ